MHQLANTDSRASDEDASPISSSSSSSPHPPHHPPSFAALTLFVSIVFDRNSLKWQSRVSVEDKLENDDDDEEKEDPHGRNMKRNGTKSASHRKYNTNRNK